MKELLHIPTGNLITWYVPAPSDYYDYHDRYLSFGERYPGINPASQGRIIREIASGTYNKHFYIRNGIPENCSQAEFEIIEV